MHLRIITKKYVVDSAIQFLKKKTILGPMVLTDTTRKRGSESQNFLTYQFLEAKLVLLDSEIRSSLQRCTFSSGYRIRLILPPPHKLA